MSKSNPLICDFSAGELSPKMDARADSDIYAKGCKTLENFYVYVHGGVQKRPGTRYVSTVKYPDKDTRVLSYIYGESIAYVLEFGDHYMRVYTNGGQVQVAGAPYEIVTPYAYSDVWDIKFVQSADVMYMVHPDYMPQKLIRYSDSIWTIANVPFVNGPFMDENIQSSHVLTTTNTTGNITVTATGFSPFSVDHVGSIWRLKGNIRNSAEINIDDSWTDSVEADRNENIFIEIGGVWVGTVTLQRSSNDGATWEDVYVYKDNINTTHTEYEDDIIYRLGIKSGDYTSGTVSLTLGKLNQYGYFKITNYTSPTQVTGTVEKVLPTTSTSKWAEGSWSNDSGYPRAIAFFEEKLIFAGTYAEPQTLWFSQTDDYENFEAGVTLSDALVVTLASNNINTIQWLLDSQTTLHVGTIASEWHLETTDTAPFISAYRQSSFGSNFIQSIPVGQLILYIQKGGKKLRQRYYSYEPDTWISNEISLISEHLFKEGIYDLTYIDDPEPMVLMTRSDGIIVGCTFDTVNKVIAYFTWSTDGNFQSLTSIPGTTRDEVWVVVQRTNENGSTQFIEQFQSNDWDELEDAWYLDSALKYSGELSTTFSGIDHLEGLDITPTADGAVLPETPVVNGTFVLEEQYSNIIAGLPYAATLQTMSLEAGADFGTAQTRHKAISRLSARLYKTLGLKLGVNINALDIVPFRNSSDPMGLPPALFTGDKAIEFPHGYDRYITICAVSDQPTPCSILALIPSVSTKDY